MEIRRPRLQPPVPPPYFGDAVFRTTPTAAAAYLQSKPTWYAASRIHDALARADNYYLRSFLIYLELNHPRPCELDTGVSSMRCPILWINSWIMLPIHDADFTNLHGTLCNAS
ncbi:hypothetical protein FF2_046165 [Malus domestica]